MNSHWPAQMRLALRLGIAPEAFWRLSWREWRWLDAAPQAPAMDRSTLDDLMQQFPDTPK